MTTHDSQIAAEYVIAARHELNHSLAKIKHCFDQLDDSHMGWRPFPEQNSLTNLILHLCGNMTQWIISAAGDEPDERNRPAEFAERNALPKKELIARLIAVVEKAERVLSDVPAEKLLERRRIQATDTTVLGAIFTSVSHLPGHTHQIVYITRLHLREKYQFQWEPETAEQQGPKSV